MGHFSMEIYALSGSLLSGNQHFVISTGLQPSGKLESHYQ